jgi:hypothetical protein
VSESPYLEPAAKPVAFKPPSPARTEWFSDRDRWAVLVFVVLVVLAVRFMFWTVMPS